MKRCALFLFMFAASPAFSMETVAVSDYFSGDMLCTHQNVTAYSFDQLGNRWIENSLPQPLAKYKIKKSNAGVWEVFNLGADEPLPLPCNAVATSELMRCGTGPTFTFNTKDGSFSEAGASYIAVGHCIKI
jgi:hypothetical protein